MDILAVLAHIYKERIVSYTLKYHNINDTDYGWKDLVVPDEDSLEARMLKSAKELYSNMDVGLITDIDYFTEIYPVPLTVRPVDSVYFVKAACKKARKFKFNEGDRQKELVGRLCTVIEKFYKEDYIPTGEDVLNGPDWLTGETDD